MSDLEDVFVLFSRRCAHTASSALDTAAAKLAANPSMSRIRCHEGDEAGILKSTRQHGKQLQDLKIAFCMAYSDELQGPWQVYQCCGSLAACGS